MLQNERDKIIEWWDDLTEEEHKRLCIEYGYFGHDEGLNIENIREIWRGEFT